MSNYKQLIPNYTKKNYFMTYILKVVTLSLCLLNKILIVKKTHIKQSTQTVETLVYSDCGDTLVYSDCGHTSLLRLWRH